MSIFRELRERKGWTIYQASKELGMHYAEYERLENGKNGERFLKKLFKMMKATGANLNDIRKYLQQNKD